MMAEATLHPLYTDNGLGRPVHPDAPGGGGSRGHFVQAGTLGAGASESQISLPHRQSPAGRRLTLERISAADRGASLLPATVWAGFFNFEATFQANPSSGWSHLLTNLHNLNELMAGLSEAKLHGRVKHLALVAHNESGRAGVVTYGPPIAWSDSAAIAIFGRLEIYLRHDGMLSLYSCISGGGREGDELLKKASDHLPGRTVVAFCAYVHVSKVGNNDPGNVCGQVFRDGPCDKALEPLTPWGWAAKRARNGQIVHVPALEKKSPRYLCANPKCPGHLKAEDDCPNW
jgi:hypothetical protein